MSRLLPAAVLVALLMGTPSLAQHRTPERMLDGREARGSRVEISAGRTGPMPLSSAALPVNGPSEDVPLGVPPELDTASRLLLTGDGRMVASGLTSGTVVQQVVESGAFLWSATLGESVHDIAIAGDLVAAALGRDGEVVLLDLDSGDEVRRIGVAGEPVQVRFSRDGTLLFVASLGADQIAVIETATGDTRTTIDTPIVELFRSVLGPTARTIHFYTPFEPTPDAQLVVVGTADGVATFDVVTGRLVASAALDGPAMVIEMTEASGAVVRAWPFGGSQGWTLAWYDPAAGTAETQLLPSPLPFSAMGVVVSKDESTVLVNAGGDAIAVSRGGTPRFIGRAEQIVDLGGGVAGVLGQETYRVDLESMTVSEPAENPYRLDSVTGVASAADGETLVWVREGERAAYISFADREPAAVDIPLGRAPELDGPRFVALSPSGRTAALSFYQSGQVAIVELATRRLLRTMSARMDQPASLAFLSDTELVVVGSDLTESRGEVVLLDVEAGTLLQRVVRSALPYHTVLVDQTRGHVYVHSRFTQILQGFRRSGDELVSFLVQNAGGAPVTNQLSGTIPYVALSPSGRHSVGVDPLSNQIVIVDLLADAVEVLTVTGDLDQIAFSPGGDRAAISSWDGAVHLLDLTDTPRLVATTPLDVPFSGIVFDADVGRFVVAPLFRGTGGLLEVDPETGAVVGERALPSEFNADALLWSPETGVVASGAVVEGFEVRGGMWSEQTGAVLLSGRNGRTVLVPGEPLALTALVQTDAVSFLDLTLPPTDRSEEADGTDVSLTALGTPSRRLRARLSGAPQTHARVEVVDLLGRIVAVLHDGPFAGGDLGLEWGGASSGTYVVRLVGSSVTARATVVR